LELFDPEKNIMEDNLMGQVIKFIGNEAQLFGWKGRFRLSVSLAMVGILVFMLLLMLTGAQPLGAQGAETSVPAGVGPGVEATLVAQGEAHVMIALVQTPAMRFSMTNLEALSQEIAIRQQRVLDSLDASEFRLRHQYQAVPALAGTVLSPSALSKLAENPDVARVDLDMEGKGSLDTTVPLIGADHRHALGNTGAGVVVAVLDSGIDTDHDDLADDLIWEECFLDNDGTINGNGLCPNGSDRQTGAGAAEDDHGHGTHVNGIITSNGTQSSVGVAPDADIVAIKVLDSNNAFFFFSEIVAGLDFIINNRPDVNLINMSLGTNALYNGDCDNSNAGNMAGAAAINTLRANGVTAFAASGNDSSGTQMSSPACLSNVISVGATDNNDNVADFTNSNASTDIMAPGVGVVSDDIGNGTTTRSGTSMASPHAAACAALLMESGEATTPDDIENRLETSTIQVTDATNGLTFPRIDCHPENDPPVADAGGPYTTDEGVPVMLDGSNSSDPDGDPLTFAWDLDDDGNFDDATGITTTFDMVGQDGVYNIALEVTDISGQTDVDQTTVTVNNVAPTVSLNSDAPQDEGATVTVNGLVSDPGWLDPLSAEIDWGDGSPPEPVNGIVENNPPDATLTFTATHVYGDNGVFTAEVCASDDDTTTCEMIDLQIDNVNPTATINLTNTILINGVPTFLAAAGEPVDFSGNSTDPGSDDLTLRWDWGDGSPVDETIDLVNPPDPDPFPSPSIQPRDVDVNTRHTFADACLYEISFWAEDDDGGVSATDTAYVVIVGTALRARHTGYWQHQYSGNGQIDFDEATLQCYLDITGFMSNVFHEERDASTLPQAYDVLFMGQNGGSHVKKLDRQLLTVWLNVANGAMGYLDQFDTDGDGSPDTPLADIMATAETVRLDPTSSKRELREQTRLLIQIINQTYRRDLISVFRFR
jgi:subtilisin family serine protease